MGPAEAEEPLILIGGSPYCEARNDAAHYAGRTERGGILLGFRRGVHLHVNAVTRPTRWDRASMFAFHRHTRGHAATALRRWRQTGETCDWLGEWHSHPEQHPQPSSIDLRCWQGITRVTGVPMVFVIFGYSETWVGLMEPGSEKPVRYYQVETSNDGILFSCATAKG